MRRLISDYSSNGTMNELARIRKEAFIAWFKGLSQYLFGEAKKNYRELNPTKCSLGRSLNQGSPIYEAFHGDVRATLCDITTRLFFTFCSGTQVRKKNSKTKQSLMKYKVREHSKTKLSGNKLVSPLKLFTIFSCLASGKKWLQPNKIFKLTAVVSSIRKDMVTVRVMVRSFITMYSTAQPYRLQKTPNQLEWQDRFLLTYI